MFNALSGLVTDAVKLVDAAVEVPVAAARIITKPVADAAEAVKDEILDLIDED